MVNDRRSHVIVSFPDDVDVAQPQVERSPQGARPFSKGLKKVTFVAEFTSYGVSFEATKARNSITRVI
jgi:hypothetical protein